MLSSKLESQQVVLSYSFVMPECKQAQNALIDSRLDVILLGLLHCHRLLHWRYIVITTE